MNGWMDFEFREVGNWGDWVWGRRGVKENYILKIDI